MEIQRTQNSQNSFKNYSKVGQLILIPRFIIKLTGIKTAWDWHKDRHRPTEQIRVQKDRYIYGQLKRKYIYIYIFSPKKGVETARYPYKEEKKILNLKSYLTTYTKFNSK